MRNFMTAVVLLALGLVLLMVRGPSLADAQLLQPSMVGLGPDKAPRILATTDAGQLKVAPAPMAPDLAILRPDGGPYTIAAGASDCAYVGSGRSFELTCSTAQCHYRMVARLPDAGFPTVFPDAGVASPFDTVLPADTPHLEHLPAYRDSVCAEFEAAGTMCPSPLFQ